MPNKVATYNFGDNLRMSQGHAENVDIDSILLSIIPGALSAFQAHEKNDRNGVDWWVECHGKFLGVDCKVRRQDWALRGQDDLALETWSVVEKKVIGWTRDAYKRTDYILWLWKESKRWCLIPFPMLCKVFSDNWIVWKNEFKTREQFTPNHGGYHSECVFVPRKIVWRFIYRAFSGCPVAVQSDNKPLGQMGLFRGA